MTASAPNAIPLPKFMYGTAWKKDATTKLVELAVESGFQAIDTANQLIHYQEALVGDALLALKQKGVGREKLFLQTKFTSVDGQGRETPYDAKANLTEQVKQSMDSSLIHLHTDYVDSYLLHGPYSRHGLGPEDWEVWASIEDQHAAGKTRMIGISNVTAEQLSALCKQAKIKPSFVQNRCYASLGWDKEVRKICTENGIIYQGFSLLTANGKYLAESSIRSIAKILGVNATQVIFRFAMQIGMLPLTGTTNADHMKDDLRAEGIELTAADMKLIESIGL